MRRWNSTFCPVFFLLFIGVNITGAQSRAELESQRNKLNKQIKQTSKLINKTRIDQKATLADLKTLREEMKLRQKVISNLKTEKRVVGVAIGSAEDQILEIDTRSQDLKLRHARQMRQVYLDKTMEHPVMMLLSAQTVNQALQRWRYLQLIRNVRQETLSGYADVQDSLVNRRNRLAALFRDQQALSAELENEENALENSVRTEEKSLSALKKKERGLRSNLEKQKNENAKLTSEIERIIKAELARASTSSGALPNAPALAALTSNFEQNKGNLPWPVNQGLITGRFGDQPHPVIPSIKISNNGIDITASSGSVVKSIFTGTVVGKKFIPGFDHMVIVQHGNYYSVYSRLAETHVQVGDAVKTGDVVGTLANSTEENSKLHLEIWQSKTQMDPEKWITK